MDQLFGSGTILEDQVLEVFTFLSLVELTAHPLLQLLDQCVILSFKVLKVEMKELLKH
jgi:hypothetical protein